MQLYMESDAVIDEQQRKISFKIKVLRQVRRIQQTELAQAVGITQTHLSNIENGKSAVTLENLLRIRAALGCTMGEFFTEIDETHEKKFYSVQDVLNVLEIMNKKE